LARRFVSGASWASSASAVRSSNPHTHTHTHTHTHNDIKYTAPLTAITAAVVGVIASLAVFFGYHVLWPIGPSGAFDWISAAVAVAAAIALIGFKRNVIHVILVCATLGLVVKSLA
jgi:chromate transporter